MRGGRASEAASGAAVAVALLLALAGCASEPESRTSPASSSAMKDRAAPTPATVSAVLASDEAPPSEVLDGGYARDPSPRDPGRYWLAPDPDRPGRSHVVEVPGVAQRAPRPAEAVPGPPPAPLAADPGATPRVVEVKPTK